MGKRRFLIVVSDRPVKATAVYGLSYYLCGDPYAVFLWKLNKNVVCVANPVVRATSTKKQLFDGILYESRKTIRAYFG